MNRWGGCFAGVFAALLLAIMPAAIAQAHDAVPHGTAVLDLVGFDQRLNHEIPAGLVFIDENGEKVELRRYLGDKPIIMALSYFECETLCPMVRYGLVDALRPLGFTVGDEFEVILVSIDPEESAEVTKAVKEETLASYGRGRAEGWHFLRGEHDPIDELADAIGFRYAYDGQQDEYAHPSGLVLVTPEGRISRYFFGIEYDPQDLRLGLVETSQNRIGTAIDQLLLMCYHYDPVAGKYNLLVWNVLRVAGAFTVAIMGFTIFYLLRKESQQTASLS